MSIRIILMIIMGVLLLGWVIFVAIMFIKNGRKQVVALGLAAKVKCKKCGMTYEVSPEEYTKCHMSKSVSTTHTKLKNGAMVNNPEYQSYEIKFMCPSCGKKEYAQVENINEINEKSRAAVFAVGLKHLLYIVIGGLTIMAVMSIPLKIEERARMQKVEQMRQQQYEEFKNSLK